MDWSDALKVAAMLKAEWVADEDGTSHYATRIRNRGSIAREVAAGVVPVIEMEVWAQCGKHFSVEVKGPGERRCPDCSAPAGSMPALAGRPDKAFPPRWEVDSSKAALARCASPGHEQFHRRLYVGPEAHVYFCESPDHKGTLCVWTDPPGGPFKITRSFEHGVKFEWTS